MKVPKELLAIARVLQGLRRPVAFVGGMVAPLLVSDPAAAPARATKDVDVIVKIDTTADYYALGEELRARGLAEIMDDEVVCRYRRIR